MTKYYYIKLFIFIVTPFTNLCSQVNVISHPVRFSQYYNNFSLVNPASIGFENITSASVGNKRLTGNFNNISTYRLNADTRIAARNKLSNKPFSVLGIDVSNDREGKYINRSRFYVVYAWHASIRENLKFSGGFKIGGMNYNVQGTPLSGSGSDIAPDGAFGFWFYNPKICLGTSYHQIFNSSIQPLEEVAHLKSYINISGKAVLYNRNKLSLELAALSSILIDNSSDRMQTDINLILDLYNRLGIVAGVHNNNRIVNSIILFNLLNSKNSIDIHLTYGYSRPGTAINTNFVEFGVCYCPFKK